MISSFLIYQGADVNRGPIDGLDSGASPLFLAVRKGHKAVVEKLLEAKADINKANVKGESPLFVAAVEGHAFLVQVLIEHGADVGQRNVDKKKPFDVAKDKGIAALLWAHDPDEVTRKAALAAKASATFEDLTADEVGQMVADLGTAYGPLKVKIHEGDLNGYVVAQSLESNRLEGIIAQMGCTSKVQQKNIKVKHCACMYCIGWH